MKYLRSKLLTSILVVGVVFVVASCDSLAPKPDLPIPLDKVQHSNGAFLRIASVNSAAFDLAKPDQAAFSFRAEYVDGKDNSLLKNVEFYSDYTSFALDPTKQKHLEETSKPIYTVSASEFTPIDSTGVPSTVISVPLTKVLAGFSNLTKDSLGVGDTFHLRWVVNLTDGRSFSVDDASPAIQGGFYNSPYNARVKTVQKVPENMFVGSYHFVAQNKGVFGWDTFQASFDADLSVDQSNTLNGRTFSAVPYPNSGFALAPITMHIALGPTATATSESYTHLGCSAGLYIGPMSNPEQNGVIIDVTDDSGFTMVLGDNTEADCGTGPVDVTYKVTKN